jgi:hypothetical protein
MCTLRKSRKKLTISINNKEWITWKFFESVWECIPAKMSLNGPNRTISMKAHPLYIRTSSYWAVSLPTQRLLGKSLLHLLKFGLSFTFEYPVFIRCCEKHRNKKWELGQDNKSSQLSRIDGRAWPGASYTNSGSPCQLELNQEGFASDVFKRITGVQHCVWLYKSDFLGKFLFRAIALQEDSQKCRGESLGN